MSSSSVPKLQTLNYVNVLAYVSNFLVVFGSDKAGLPDNATLSDKYQTLITPSAYAFAIWGIIFTAELVWTVFQTLPSYRSHPLVVKGVGYNFALASLAQCLWTIAFGLEKLSLSLVCMISILIPLLLILSKTATSEFPVADTKEYWLLKFPFEIHASWILAATCLNVNVILVGHGASATAQTAVGWLCLGLLFAAGIYATLKKESYDRVWVVPSVVTWASLAISHELSSPRAKIVESFTESTIQQTKLAATIVASVLIFLIAVEVTRIKFSSDKTPRTVTITTETAADDAAEENENSGEYSSLN